MVCVVVFKEAGKIQNRGPWQTVIFSRPWSHSGEEWILRGPDGKELTILCDAGPIRDSDGSVFGGVITRRVISVRKGMEESLRSEIAERKQVEALLRLDDFRLEALWHLGQMSGVLESRIIDFALDRQVQLTGSGIGWIGFMNEEGTKLVSDRMSQSVSRQCAVGGAPTHLTVSETGFLADVIKRREPIVINDYGSSITSEAGYPPGHALISRMLVIPVLEGDRIVAVASVANKIEPYDDADIRQLILLTDGMWKLIQRGRTEKALRDAESLAAAGKALSSVAHDMKTPLVAIGGFTRLVQKRLEVDTEEYERLDVVVREVSRLEGLIKDMLDFSRPMELKVDHTNLRRLVEGAWRWFSQLPTGPMSASKSSLPTESPMPSAIPYGRWMEICHETAVVSHIEVLLACSMWDSYSSGR
jgi:hypothetical protein